MLFPASQLVKFGFEFNGFEFKFQVFREHANKLVEVANLACSMSNNEEGVKMVKAAVKQIEVLCPQVSHSVQHRFPIGGAPPGGAKRTCQFNR